MGKSWDGLIIVASIGVIGGFAFLIFLYCGAYYPSENWDLHKSRAAYKRGLKQAESGDFFEAIQEFNTAIEKLEKSNLLRRLHRNHPLMRFLHRYSPPKYYTYKARGQALAALGQFDAAISDFNTVIHDLKSLHDSLKDRYGPLVPEAYNERGQAKAALGQFFDAIGDYNEAIRTRYRPYDADVYYYNRGMAKRKLGQHISASKDFNAADRLKAERAKAIEALRGGR